MARAFDKPRAVGLVETIRRSIPIASPVSKPNQLQLPFVAPAAVERLWWELLSKTGDVFYVHDIDGRLLFVNPAFYRETGYTEEDLPRLNVRDLLTPEDYDANALRIATAVASGEVGFPLEMAIRRKDGSFGYAEFAAAVVRSEEGQPFIVGLARDVTNRTLGDFELREAAAFQTTLVEVSLALHSAPTLNALMELICAQGRRLLGLDSARLFLLHGDDLDFAAEDGSPFLPDLRHASLKSPGMLSDALRAGKATRVQLDRGAGGESVLLLPLSGPRGAIGLLAFRAASVGNAEERLRERGQIYAMQVAVAVENARLLEDLRRADRLKSDFLASVSHDLRTPLNVIVGYTDLQLEGVLGAVNPEQDNALRRVRATALNLAGLINATLDVNRLEAGRMLIEVAPLDVGIAWQELLLQFEEHPDWGTVPLHFDAAGVPVLLGDPEKVKLILRNLVGNAMKFTRAGAIAVTARYDRPARMLAFDVADTGSGISEEDLPHIFGMFRQGTDPGRSRGGVGLGLYLVKRVVELLGGSISVQSRVGSGSTFHVTLPASPASDVS